MSEIYLANSALKQEGYDGLRTIDEATKAGFSGVQLYINPTFYSEEYIQKLATELTNSRLGLIIHLPNTPGPEDLLAAINLAKLVPGARALVHYDEIRELPPTGNLQIGWENSVTGEFAPNHVDDVYRISRQDGTFFVFDIGRGLYAPDDNVTLQEKIIAHTRKVIGEMGPEDVLHIADKTSWSKKFRDAMCAEGKGVARIFLDDIRKFSGVVVFEHENLEMALASLPVLRP